MLAPTANRLAACMAGAIGVRAASTGRLQRLDVVVADGSSELLTSRQCAACDLIAIDRRVGTIGDEKGLITRAASVGVSRGDPAVHLRLEISVLVAEPVFRTEIRSAATDVQLEDADAA